jgi:hypothetical protein
VSAERVNSAQEGHADWVDRLIARKFDPAHTPLLFAAQETTMPDNNADPHADTNAQLQPGDPCPRAPLNATLDANWDKPKDVNILGSGGRPTVGRIVHYLPTPDERIDNPSFGSKGQPYPAIITHVHESGEVNLHIYNDPTWMVGRFMKARVPRSQEPLPTAGTWQWPPRV